MAFFLSARLPPRRPGFDSRGPGHVSLGTTSLGWRWVTFSALYNVLRTQTKPIKKQQFANLQILHLSNGYKKRIPATSGHGKFWRCGWYPQTVISTTTLISSRFREKIKEFIPVKREITTRNLMQDAYCKLFVEHSLNKRVWTFQG